MYGYELPTDPDCVKSKTRFVITFAGFPVYWASTLQTKTLPSTMESEINALDNRCREILSIVDITISLG